MTDLLALAERDIPLRRAAATSGGEWCGPCPGCGGYDRFRVWPERGRYWCRQCGKKGDAIEYLRDFHGLSFAEAKRVLGLDPSPVSRQQRTHNRAHRLALTIAREAYQVWSYHKLIELTDRYRELTAEREAAATAYRLLNRRPDLVHRW